MMRSSNSSKENLYGGEGEDTLIGGAGNDRLDGGFVMTYWKEVLVMMKFMEEQRQTRDNSPTGMKLNKDIYYDANKGSDTARFSGNAADYSINRAVDEQYGYVYTSRMKEMALLMGLIQYVELIT